MAEAISYLNDAEFDGAVLQSDTPVLVDFWAEWCEPCKRVEPVLHELAAHYNGRLRIGKLNVEENRQTAVKYMVRGLPTFMIFKNGQVQATQIGVVSKTQLMQFIDRAL
jgi:thioredoxin 1